jgi:AcrR family transcriptional regulator
VAASAEPRIPLSRDRILATALGLADERGIEAVTMRELGRALGFEAMSLYNHVANKDDVLDGILDLVLAECEPPSPDEDWAATVRESAISVHDALGRHPWAAALLMAPTRVREPRLRYMDALLGRLRDAGFDADTTYHAYHVLDAHIFGFSVWQASHTYSPEEVEQLVEEVARTITPEEYPHLHEHARQHMTDGPHREVSAFAFGLDLILDGLEELRSRGQSYD